MAGREGGKGLRQNANLTHVEQVVAVASAAPSIAEGRGVRKEVWEA